ncbi:MAG: hypothetical protein L0220_18500, partial [Acidobacteria bacterium]|nr:hypothetical protein [Acidobacteriota bacterium]
MRNLFYQANFCAECGNNLLDQRRERRLPRYFCDDCAARISRRGYLTPLSLLVALVIIFLTFREREPSARLDQSQMFIPPAAVSAHDATAGKILQLKSKTEDRFLCGARTKKGTPCRRLVRS